jgi:CheY-like chemotaxis protein
VRSVLEPNYRVLEADDGQDGLERAREALPDLVVSDVMMPKLDGRQMVRKIRARPGGRDIPIILMSAARGLAADDGIGHNVFLEKPFDLDEFLEHVTRLTATRPRKQ